MDQLATRNFFYLVFLFTFSICATWAFAMPVFSGGDETVHAINDYTFYHGNFLPKLSSIPGKGLPNQYEVAYVYIKGLNGTNWPADGIACYIAQFNNSAKCDKASLTGKPIGTHLVQDWVSHEPVLPTILTGLPVSLSPNKVGFYGSRLLVAGFSALFLSISLTIAYMYRKRMLTLMITLAIAPSFFGNSGTLGTSWLEDSLTVLVCTSLVCLLEEEYSPGWLKHIFLASLGMLSLSQATSLLIVGFIGVAALFYKRELYDLKFFGSLKDKIFSLMLFMMVSVSVIWLFFISAPLNPKSAIVFKKIFSYSFGNSPLEILRVAIKSWGTLWNQMIVGQGWVPSEFLPPQLISWLWLAITFIIIFFSIFFSSAKTRLLFIVCPILFFFVPIIYSEIFFPKMGIGSNNFWLGRYQLPLYMAILIMCSIPISKISISSVKSRLINVLIGFIACLQVFNFMFVLHRYTVGTLGAWNFPAWLGGWHPPVEVPILLVLNLLFNALFYSILMNGNRIKHC